MSRDSLAAENLVHQHAAHSVAAVIVAYEPDLRTLEHLSNIMSQQCGAVIIVNNSESEAYSNLPRPLNSATIILNNGGNQGIAHAHNRGIEWALAHEYDYVLLLDQDSQPAPDMLRQLLEAHAMIKAEGIEPGAVGASYLEAHSGQRSFFLRLRRLGFHRISSDATDEPVVQVDHLISSGMLISRKALILAGLMDESLFIDHVDSEWCLRARAKGLRHFGCFNATMRHQLGDKSLRLWFGRWRHYSVHSPIRCYYIFRNSIHLMSLSYVPLRWKWMDLRRLLLLSAFHAIFLPNRVLTLRLMLTGIYHGLRGIDGKIRDSKQAIKTAGLRSPSAPFHG